MPSTVNGIGTHYYGKKNLASRSATCPHCHAQVVLSSYDTRLFFVVIFVPIISLGRKRIIDQCPRCTRHWAMPMHEYEQRRQQTLEETLRRYDENPTRDEAITVHGTLVAFHQIDSAAKFRQATDATDVDLQVTFAAQLDGAGYTDAASPLYEQLLQQQPELEAARAGVALRRIAAGRLDEARQLLDFLTVPGAARDHALAPLERLAYAYEKQRRPAEAWEACSHLLRELPNLADVPVFRRFVAKLERTVLPPQSLLPPDRRPAWKRWFGGDAPIWNKKILVPAILLTLLVTALGVNEYRRRHRTLHVVNGYGDPVTMVIDGGPPVSVARDAAFTLVEGTHEVAWSGPSEGRQAVDLQTGFWTRWTRYPAWVLNIDGVAPLVEQTVIYATNPVPSTSQGLLGEKFVMRSHVDYAFTAPPAEMELSNAHDQVQKQRLHVETLPLNHWAESVIAKSTPEVAQSFLESHLRRPPYDAPLLDVYVSFARRSPQGERATKFLADGLWREPLSVAWHRAYQQLSTGRDSDDALRTRYDALLAGGPPTAGLLHLRGEVTEDRRAALDFDRRAVELDERLGWAQFNLGRDQALRGDWNEARRRLDLTLAAGYSNPTVRTLRLVAVVAQGQTALAEQEMYGALASSDASEQLFGLFQRCAWLAGQDRFDEVTQQTQAWFQKSPWAVEVRDSIQPVFDYLRQDDGVLSRPDHLNKLDPELRIDFLLAAGRTAEAASIEKTGATDPRSSLGLACAYYAEGNGERGEAWIEWACRQLEAGDASSRFAAKLLAAESPPSEEDLTATGMAFGRQTLLAAVIGWKFPERRAEYHALARRWNISRLPPYRLVERVTRAPE